MKLDHIVACIDFAPASESALIEAERIAVRESAELTALHVIDLNVVEQARIAIPNFAEGDAIERAKVHLDEWIERTAKSEMTVETEIVQGHPLEEIVKAIGDHKADLLVMGSKGVSHRKEVTGFTAAKCVRKAPTKVLLVREGHAGPFEKIVACVDFSETSDRAIEHALHMAKEDGAALELLHVVSPLQGLVGMEYLFPRVARGEAATHVKPDVEAEVRKRLDRFASEARGVEIKTTIVENSSIGNGVIRQLNDSNADLVVLGTRGRTGMKQLLLGTVAEKVVHDSPCSVFAIKPHGFSYHHITA